MSNFWGQISLILPSPKIPQAAKCPNTPVLHTTDMFYADAEPTEDFVILAKTNSFKESIDRKKKLFVDLDLAIYNLGRLSIMQIFVTITL